MDQTFAVFKDAKNQIGRIWAKDKHAAAVEWVFTGTNTGDGPGMKATNEPTGLVGVAILDVGDDGLIKEERRYSDSMTTIGQLNPDPKNPVRPVVTAPANGMDMFESKGTPDDTKAVDAENAFYAAVNAKKHRRCDQARRRRLRVR